eukprot:gene6528-7824_t
MSQVSSLQISEIELSDNENAPSQTLPPIENKPAAKKGALKRKKKPAAKRIRPQVSVSPKKKKGRFAVSFLSIWFFFADLFSLADGVMISLGLKHIAHNTAVLLKLGHDSVVRGAWTPWMQSVPDMISKASPYNQNLQEQALLAKRKADEMLKAERGEQARKLREERLLREAQLRREAAGEEEDGVGEEETMSSVQTPERGREEAGGDEAKWHAREDKLRMELLEKEVESMRRQLASANGKLMAREGSSGGPNGGLGATSPRGGGTPDVRGSGLRFDNVPPGRPLTGRALERGAVDGPTADWAPVPPAGSPSGRAPSRGGGSRSRPASASGQKRRRVGEAMMSDEAALERERAACRLLREHLDCQRKLLTGSKDKRAFEAWEAECCVLREKERLLRKWQAADDARMVLQQRMLEEHQRVRTEKRRVAAMRREAREAGTLLEEARKRRQRDLGKTSLERERAAMQMGQISAEAGSVPESAWDERRLLEQRQRVVGAWELAERAVFEARALRRLGVSGRGMAALALASKQGLAREQRALQDAKLARKLDAEQSKERERVLRLWAAAEAARDKWGDEPRAPGGAARHYNSSYRKARLRLSHQPPWRRAVDLYSG